MQNFWAGEGVISGWTGEKIYKTGGGRCVALGKHSPHRFVALATSSLHHIA